MEEVFGLKILLKHNSNWSKLKHEDEVNHTTYYHQ